ncbi:oxaloacetate decarboxylase, beta subunit [Desulforhopalus singaporensis]|uniref:Oxaloacetate decarboxylase, beta subunit n=2 Tax=Desulforhopalus singaporensis TaxID=91360 RepID=A0A1H0KQ32_9BACT|nr:sodium ion-translocating decarboxylase subunit beta [Desulforhopalus singaporensis]SDO57883.1 oxaloacetate decarboxylase, beta subunit [Desulforhopalus singaporensis]
MKSRILMVVFLGLLLPWSSFAGTGDESVAIVSPEDAKIIRFLVQPGNFVYSGDEIATLKMENGTVIVLRSGAAGKVTEITAKPYQKVHKNEILGHLKTSTVIADRPVSGQDKALPPVSELLGSIFKTTGLAGIIDNQMNKDWTVGIGRVLMIMVGLVLLYLGIARQFEPLLLVPIGYGAILANIPLAGIAEPGGILYYIYHVGITTGVFPLIIFMGVGALTDFGPMIANPKTILLGGAAQFGIFTTLLGALFLSDFIPGINFSLSDAAAIGIIGGADGPTAIFLSSKLSPRLLGSIAIAAYSYMALVPLIQPPIMKWLTSEEERKIKMVQLRHVSKLEKIILPMLVLGICAVLLPSAAPLIGMFMLGNLAKECGVVNRLSDTIKSSLMYTVTVFLGLGVGSKLSADKFLNVETLGILALGIIAFGIGTASGVLLAKLMNKMSKNPVNPLIGAAGVSAVPMAARVVNKVGLEANPQNHLIMHAMGANVSGVIGSAVAAGVLLALLY